MGDGRRLRYPRSARVHRGSEIRAHLREGSRRRCGSLEVIRRPSQTGTPRAGIIVPRYGHTIVERNRLKRRIRSIVRSDWLPEARARGVKMDVLLRARPEAYGRTLDQLRDGLAGCLETDA